MNISGREDRVKKSTSTLEGQRTEERESWVDQEPWQRGISEKECPWGELQALVAGSHRYQ